MNNIYKSFMARDYFKKSCKYSPMEKTRTINSIKSILTLTKIFKKQGN